MSDQNTHDGTAITLRVGNTVIPATLNNTITAQCFKETLPFSITLNRYEVDYCASAAPLKTDESDRQSGWTNGDIGHFGGWFTILFDGEEKSKETSGVVIIGRIDDGHLDTVRSLGHPVRITVDLA